MFHQAQRCPHCGADRVAPTADPFETAAPAAGGAAQKPKPVSLSAEEARALLAVEAHRAPERPVHLQDVFFALLMPRSGPVDLVLSILAAPLTLATVFGIGYAMMRNRRARRRDANFLSGAELASVPLTVVVLGFLLWSPMTPGWVWAVLGTALVAWIAREVLRRASRVDPLA